MVKDLLRSKEPKYKRKTPKCKFKRERPQNYDLSYGTTSPNMWRMVKEDVGANIVEWCESADNDCKNMALKMKEKCDKYWGDPKKLNVMMFVSTILDPRYKWECVEHGIYQMYEFDVDLVVCNRVSKDIRDMFEEYKGSQVATNSSSRATGGSGGSSSSASGGSGEVVGKGIIRARYKKHKATKEDVEVKSELDKYLEEQPEEDVDGFDILKWWKRESGRYPTLSLMARDVLAIPVSTIASESVFSTKGRILDEFRISLSPKVVEALICSQDWLRLSPKLIEESVEDVENLEKEITNMSLTPPVIDI